MALAAAAAAAGSAGAFTADTIRFSAPTYSITQHLSGQGNWQMSDDRTGDPDAFKIVAGSPANGGGQLLSIQMRDSAGTAYRYYPVFDARTIELRWRWRPLDTLVHVCLGAGGDTGYARESLAAGLCFAPHGVIKGDTNAPFTTTATWKAGVWYYLRLRLDWAGKNFSAYIAEDSLRGDEKMVASQRSMHTSTLDQIKRLVIYTEPSQGEILIDDIASETYNLWIAKTALAAQWSLGLNWSRGSPPDGIAPVVFNSSGTAPCNLDTAATVGTIFFEPGYPGLFHLNARTFTVTGARADFTGLRYWAQSALGHLDLRPQKTLFLTGPSDTALPPALHNGTGTIRLTGRKLDVNQFTQTTGVLDLDTFDLTVRKDLLIRGAAASILNLGGRHITVGGAAHLEGLALASKLSLNPGAAWSITAGDSLAAKWAVLGKSTGRGKYPANGGAAWASADSSGNAGWIFEGPPVINAQPQSKRTVVGKSVTFSVAFAPMFNPSYQWYKGGDSIPGATSADYTVASPSRKDNGNKYHCVVRNSVNSATSAEATLTVDFPAPAVAPDTASFVDSVSVSVAPPVTGALLFCVPPGQAPRAVVNDTVIISAAGDYKFYATFNGGADVSDTAAGRYTKVDLLQAAAPVFLAQDTAFDDSLQVTFAAPATGVNIRYTKNGIAPTSSSALWDGKPFTVKATTTMKAFAQQAGRTDSRTVTQTYWRREEGPSSAPAGTQFLDTVVVTLTSRSATPGAPIRYTVDGSEPTAASKPYGAPFTLDSTATVKARTFIAGRPASRISSYDFFLAPDTPSPSYPEGQYFGGIDVILTSSSSKARIYYTLDGSPPGPGNGFVIKSGGSIRLDSDAVLKAMAAAGEDSAYRHSGTIVQSYTFAKADSQALSPGGELSLGGNYSLRNAGGIAVQVKPLPADSFKTIAGFAIPLGVRVETASSIDLIVVKPAGADNALYRLDSAGAPVFVSLADRPSITSPGVYFLGRDTVPPVVTLRREEIFGDSTRLVFTFTDNVAHLSLDLVRSDEPSGGLSGFAVRSGDSIAIFLKNPPGPLSPLTVGVKVSDGLLSATFPKDSAVRYEAMQKLPGVTSPGLSIGADVDEPWDLVGIPFQCAPGVTLARLRQGPGAANLSGMIWDPQKGPTGDYRDIEPLEDLPAGRAVWLGLPAALTSVALPALVTKGRSDDDPVVLSLRKGYNAITNPTLQPLYWPVSWKNPGAVHFSDVKTLYAYDVPHTKWIESDDLQPWKGYFVYSKSDTSVQLLRAAPAVKRAAAAAESGLLLTLGLPRAPELRLGAFPGAAEGAGVEDEPPLPGVGAEKSDLWSLRAGRRWGADFTAWNPGGVMRWKVAARLGNVSDTVTFPLRVTGLRAEPGMEVWAVSRARGLKYRLWEGARLPLQAGLPDSLDVYAGPAAALRPILDGVPASVERFELEAAGLPGGFVLRARVKEPVRVRWALWTPDGKRAGSGTLDLTEGIYAIPLRQSGTSSPGLRVLDAAWSGRNARGRLVRKLILP